MKVNIDLELITKLREKNNYSISYVASEIGYKTPTGYWLIEKGQRKINVEILYKLAKLYKANMEDLLQISE